jgi:hypothetical protein
LKTDHTEEEFENTKGVIKIKGQQHTVVYEMELSDWFLFLYYDWWMSDRLKYSYSVPLRTAW